MAARARKEILFKIGSNMHKINTAVMRDLVSTVSRNSRQTFWLEAFSQLALPPDLVLDDALYKVGEHLLSRLCTEQEADSPVLRIAELWEARSNHVHDWGNAAWACVQASALAKDERRHRDDMMFQSAEALAGVGVSPDSQALVLKFSTAVSRFVEAVSSNAPETARVAAQTATLTGILNVLFKELRRVSGK